jgi:outer membrane protein TolC
VTLEIAVQLAKESFAESVAARSDLSASEESLGLAKKAWLPAADLYFQWNRASRNNVFGLVFPAAGLPSISGPALDEETSQGTFGSVVAALVRWEALDFGSRSASIREAEALRRRAQASARLTEIEVSLGAADAFLAVAAADSAARAASATVERMEVLVEAVGALVQSELRPGADLSLAQAEFARARSELIRAEEIRERARVSLAEWLGRAGERVEVDADALLASSPAGASAMEGAPGAHPLAELGDAEREAADARKDAASTLFLPKLDVFGTFYGRGTGALVDGTFEGGGAGLWPERTNWALGVALRFPLLDLAARKETTVRKYLEQAAASRHERALDRVASDLERARIHLDAARRIAETTPLELEAARALGAQARARYDAGLAALLEVAEAERILRRAETEDAVARLDVWRARFEVAAAEGDVASALSELE